MDIKTHIHFEVEKDDKKYVFLMPAGGTLGTAYDAAFEVLKRILELSQEAVEKSERKEEKGECEDAK